MNTQCEKKTELIIKLLNVLRNEYPYPTRLESMSEQFSNAMFITPNFILSSGIIHYILQVIDIERCNKLVVPPYDPTLSKVFNQGVMKFLSDTSKEHPNMKIDRLRISTLATPFGIKFSDFILRLATMAVKKTFEDQGEFGTESTASQMPSKLDVTEEVAAYSEQIQNLADLKVKLIDKRKELINAVPEKYKSALSSGDPKTSWMVYADWIGNLDVSHSTLSMQYKSLKELIESTADGMKIMSKLKYPPTVNVDNLITQKNNELILKLARENHINLVDGEGNLHFDKFLKVTGIVNAKTMLVVKSSLLSQYRNTDNDLDASLAKLTTVTSDLNTAKESAQKKIHELKPLVLKTQNDFDEIANKLDLPHYSPCLKDIQVPSLSPQERSIRSPGDSFTLEVAEMKERLVRQIEDLATPKSSNPCSSKVKNEAVASYTPLAKSVMCEQAFPSIVRSIVRSSTLIMEDMVPLSTSSPVPPQEKAILRVRPVVNTPNIRPDDSFTNFSDYSDLDNSKYLWEPLPEISNLNFDSSSSNHEPTTPQFPDPPVNPPTVRRPRPSLDSLVERFAKLKENIKY